MGCSTCVSALHCPDSFTPASQYCNRNRVNETGGSAEKKEEKTVNVNYQPYQTRMREEYAEKKKTVTNSDRFRSMTDEELAMMLYEVSWRVAQFPDYIDTEQDWLDWLRQEVKE